MLRESLSPAFTKVMFLTTLKSEKKIKSVMTLPYKGARTTSSQFQWTVRFSLIQATQSFQNHVKNVCLDFLTAETKATFQILRLLQTWDHLGTINFFRRFWYIGKLTVFVFSPRKKNSINFRYIWNNSKSCKVLDNFFKQYKSPLLPKAEDRQFPNNL